MCLIAIKHVEIPVWTKNGSHLGCSLGYHGNRQDTKYLPSLKINFRHPPTQSNQEALWTKYAHKYLQGLDYYYLS